MTKTRWKRNVILYFSILIILLSMLSPALTTLASYEEAKSKYDEESAKFLEDAKEAKDVMRILEEDAEKNPKPDRNTISYVMKRLLYPGVYVNDVRDGVVAKSLEKDKDEILYDGKHACNPDAPDNLIDNNCNIPNFTTSLIQGVASPFMSDFNGAGKTSAYSVFGLGVPEKIPGGVVPVNPEKRTNTYTALELFGYNLPRTSYNGEWDQITVSNEARMLSNFGVIDNITLVGTGLWNSVKTGVGALIEGFSFNPVRWFKNIGKSFEGGVSAGINTVVDTSELNIVATNAWKRPRMDSSLYNVYVMSDSEVLRETARNYFSIFTKELNAESEKDPRLKEVLELNPDSSLGGVKKFSYDPKMETEKSKAARKKAEEKRAKEIKKNESEKFKADSNSEYFEEGYKPKYISPLTKVPKPVYYTESEQMGFWEKDPEVKAVLNKAKQNGLISKMPSGYKTYDKMVKDWEDKYEPFFQAEFSADGATIKKILEDIDVNVFTKYPHLDPKQGISRYACANPDGTIMRKSDKTVEYLYLKNNTFKSESVNPKCDSPRPPIDGGLLGTGWDSKTITDTRHISNVSGDTGIFHQLNNSIITGLMGANSFIAKVTNVILNLSFSPILEKLGIDVIVANLVEGFKDTIFFPLVTLVMSITGLLIFFQLLRNGSAFQLLGSVFITLIIFVAGAAFLMYPTSTINLVDKVPAKIDSIIANTIIVDKEDTSYCSTGDKTDGIRAAQCNVWGAMVFEPWVHLQFGTGSDNLYAKGHAPEGSKELNNKNEKLVGDAAVNMGGGKITNNWALYQLSKTKAGTINAKDNKTPLGVVDKDLYRLVDLQAGPNNGAKSDTRYFESWSGKNSNVFIVFLTFAQALLMGLAIAGLGIAKIEASFMFSITIIFLPFMLLYGLTPKGRGKLISYIGSLGTLLLKRVLITVMLVVLLKIIIVAYSKSSSLEVGALTAIFISVAFIIYRKELLSLMTLDGGGSPQMREMLTNMTPKYFKQTYQVVKQNTVGAAAGFVGAAAGVTEQRVENQMRIMGIRKEIKGLEKLQGKGKINKAQLEQLDALREEEETIEIANMSKEALTQEEYDAILEQSKLNQLKIAENELRSNELLEAEDNEENKEEVTRLSKENELLEAENREIAKKAAAGVRGSTTILSEAFKGSSHSKHLVGRMAERKIRREGYSTLSSYQNVRDTIIAEGADKITNLDEEMEYDVYKEVMSHSKNNTSKASGKNLSENEEGQLKSSPKVQKRIRKLAKDRREIIEEGDYSAIIPDLKEIEKAARIVDRRRGVAKVKLATTNPVNSINAHKEEMKKQKEASETISSAETIKKQLIDEIESRNGTVEYDNKGNFTVRDKYAEDNDDNKSTLSKEEKELIKRAEEMRQNNSEQSPKNEPTRRNKEEDE